MPVQKPFILFFDEVDKGDIPLVGGKGANLGEMTKAKFNVPYGFAITVASYDQFLSENMLLNKVNTLANNIDVEDTKQLAAASRQIVKLIISSRMPKDVMTAIEKAYKQLSGSKAVLVAVRSSATAEDLPNASFAGQQATYLNIKGVNSLINAVRDCYASLFSPRAIYYRFHNKIDTNITKISVIVQKMVQSSVSGVMFTLDPVTNAKDRIIIEAVWGLGELIVQGSVVPDRYVVQKDTFAILSKEISDQSIALVKVGGQNKEVAIPKSQRGIQKITDDEVVELAKVADRLQKHYYFPQDIEWAKQVIKKFGRKQKSELFITQTRPVTTTKNKMVKTKDGFAISEAPFLTGLSASPGIGSGEVRIVTDPKYIGIVKEGDVLVSKMTSPDFVPAMKRASAIITDEGGQTAHAAIVSRELGIPCVVGTKVATKKLKDGVHVTVDGSKGLVFLGSKVSRAEKSIIKEKDFSHLTSATKLYVNLAEPEKAYEVAKLNPDGVGLLRAEFMMADIGIHPKEAIKLKKQESYVAKLVVKLTQFCKAFDGKPVIYRATDFKTNEYRALAGGNHWEPQEPNPMLGFRGAFRYVANPEVFTLELRAIKEVRKVHKNLHLMIPYVRSPEELRSVKKIIRSQGLLADTSFKLWMMVELPVNVIRLQDFIDVGIDGVSVGSNDLTMLLLGTDRDNAEVAQAFEEVSEVLIWSLKRIIRICKKNNVTTSICGQAPSNSDELVIQLVRLGVTSLSINPDSINRLRHLIVETEKEIGRK